MLLFLRKICVICLNTSVTYLNMSWAYCGTGAYSEGLHWHLLTTHLYEPWEGPRQGDCTPCDKNERYGLMYGDCHSNWLERLLAVVGSLRRLAPDHLQNQFWFLEWQSNTQNFFKFIYTNLVQSRVSLLNV